MIAPATSWIEQALGRSSSPEPLDEHLAQLRGKRILVTGAAGSIGARACVALDDAGLEFTATDVAEMDVTELAAVDAVIRSVRPDIILHLAGAKHAPIGEENPAECVAVNIEGTRNVLIAAPIGVRIVTASTCKSCDPETAYGATKLIAERMTLNHGGSVARFHNVVDTSGNVFELWRNDDGPIDVMPCERYLISSDEAVSLLLFTAAQDRAGRYCFDPGTRHRMVDVADRLYPGRVQRIVKPRRGDRIAEPLTATAETFTAVTSRIMSVRCPHDESWTA